MKILVDMVEVSMDRLHASIPIYLMRFISAIKLEDRKYYTLLIRKDMENFFRSSFPDFKVLFYHGMGYRWYFWRNPLYYYSCYKLKRIIQRYHFNAVFIATDYPVYTLFKFKCRKVVVIHDLKGLKYNNNNVIRALFSLHLNRLYGKSIQTADAVIAISKYTKQDIRIYYPKVAENKIHIIYNSVTLADKAVKPVGFVEFRYILFVNTLQCYKNVATVVQAYHLINREIDNKLIIVGKKTQYWEEQIMPYIRSCNMENRIIQLQNLTDKELRYLYEHASLFVTSSLNEGFGYTPIEAAMCKCPVVCSIQEALPDVTQELLNYYQPAMDAEALADRMIQVLKNPPSAEELNQIAETYASLYSPTRQAGLIQKLLTDTPPPHQSTDTPSSDSNRDAPLSALAESLASIPSAR